MIVKGMYAATEVRMRVILATASVRSAALTFAENRVGLLVVCDPDGRAVGIISKSDLVRHLAAGGAGRMLVSPVMSRDIVTCTPEDDLYSTWQMMAARGLQNLPVLGSEGEPV